MGRTSPVGSGCVCASRAARGPLPLPLPGKERDEAEKQGVASHAGGNPAEAGVDQGDENLGHEGESYPSDPLRSNAIGWLSGELGRDAVTHEVHNGQSIPKPTQ